MGARVVGGLPGLLTDLIVGGRSSSTGEVGRGAGAAAVLVTLTTDWPC